MKIFADLINDYPELIEANFKDIPISEVLQVLGYKFISIEKLDNKFAKANDYGNFEIIAIGEDDKLPPAPVKKDEFTPVVDAPLVEPVVKKVVPPVVPIIKPKIEPKPAKSNAEYHISITKKSDKGGEVENREVNLKTDKPISPEMVQDMITKIESAESDIEASVKSKYKKIMQDKPVEELEAELQILKEERVDSELETEMIKDKIKILDKLLNKSSDDINKQEKEIEEEVKEKEGKDGKFKNKKGEVKEDKEGSEAEVVDPFKKETDKIKKGKDKDESKEIEEKVEEEQKEISEVKKSTKKDKKELETEDEPSEQDLMANQKIESAEKYEMPKKEAEKYFNLREVFDTDKKAETRIKALEKKGYTVVHFTKYTQIEGTERKFWWEIEANFPLVTSEETKIEQKIEELPLIKEIKVKDAEKVEQVAILSSDTTIPIVTATTELTKEDKEIKVKELTIEMENLLAAFYEHDDSVEGKNAKNNIRAKLDLIKKDIETLNGGAVVSAMPLTTVQAGQVIKADPTTGQPAIAEISKNADRPAPQETGNTSGLIIPKQEGQVAVAEKDKGKDSFDLAQGIKLPNGYIVHKDDKTNELYVMDKTGQEPINRVPANALKDDIPTIIDFFAKLLGLSAPATADKGGTPAKEPAEEAKTSDKDSKLQEISTKIDELLNVEKGENPVKEKNGDEENNEKQNQELAALKKEIEQKKGQVKQILDSLIDDNKIVIAREDIQRHIISGENAIHATKKAKEEKVQALSKKLWAMDNDTLKVITDVFVNKTKTSVKGNNVGDFLMFLND